MQNKKKLLTIPLIGLLGIAALTSCGGGERSDFDVKTHEIYELYKTDAEARGVTPKSYDEWLATIKGETGDKGPQGDKGDKGDQGDQGPQGDKGETGDKGPQGDKGDQGPQGDQGQEGIAVLCGEDDPTGIGKDGDTYINTKTGEVWKKTSGTWTTTGANVRGPQGDPGASIHISDKTEPDQNLGKIGDCCICSDGSIWKKIQGPSAGTEFWYNTEENVRGPKGDKGDKGDQGDQGPQGTQGIAGLNVLAGAVDPTDSIGNDGDHYINTTDGYIWTKANGTWTRGQQTVKGPSGVSMFAGQGSPDVKVGNEGDHYVNVITGKIYKKANNEWSETGQTIKGPQGNKGDKGAKGDTGKSVYSGVDLPDATKYNVDDLFVRTSDFTIWTVIIQKDGEVDAKTWSQRSETFKGSEFYIKEKVPTEYQDFGKIGDICMTLEEGKLYLKAWDTQTQKEYWKDYGRLRTNIYSGPDNPNNNPPQGAIIGDIYVCTSTDTSYAGHIFTKTASETTPWQISTGSIRGPRGEKGEDGTRIYSGEVAPTQGSPADARTGDLYIHYQSATNDVYIRKDGGIWEKCMDLKGNQIRFGNGLPAFDLQANVGDVYLDMSTGDFYLKTNDYSTQNPWVLQANIRYARYTRINLCEGDPPQPTENDKVGDIYISQRLNIEGRAEDTWIYVLEMLDDNTKDWVQKGGMSGFPGPKGEKGEKGEKGDPGDKVCSYTSIPFSGGYVVMTDASTEKKVIGSAKVGEKVHFKIVVLSEQGATSANLYLNETLSQTVTIHYEGGKGTGISLESTMPETGYVVRVELN